MLEDKLPNHRDEIPGFVPLLIADQGRLRALQNEIVTMCPVGSALSLFSWRRPGAGSIGFPKLLGEDVEVFCDSLVKTAGVLLLPGSVYDDPGNHFRIGFGRKNLPAAIERLEDFLQKR